MSEKALILLLTIMLLTLWVTREESYQLPPLPPKPKPSKSYKPPPEKSWAEERAEELETETSNLWQPIHPSFNTSLVRSWKLDGHNYITANKWIRVGVLPSEHELVSWISWVKASERNKNFKGYEFNNPEWVINQYGSRAIERLRREWEGLGKPTYY